LTGSDILIPCNVSGYPVPYVTWTKDGSKFSSNKRQKVATDGLRIVDFIVSDIGNYTCTARNILGIDNNTTTVDMIKT
jgi:titin